jgi:hypothetical protein
MNKYKEEDLIVVPLTAEWATALDMNRCVAVAADSPSEPPTVDYFDKLQATWRPAGIWLPTETFVDGTVAHVLSENRERSPSKQH